METNQFVSSLIAEMKGLCIQLNASPDAYLDQAIGNTPSALRELQGHLGREMTAQLRLIAFKEHVTKLAGQIRAVSTRIVSASGNAEGLQQIITALTTEMRATDCCEDFLESLADMLGQLGERAISALPVLSSLMKQGDATPSASVHAVRAMGKIGGSESHRMLVEFLGRRRFLHVLYTGVKKYKVQSKQLRAAIQSVLANWPPEPGALAKHRAT